MYVSSEGPQLREAPRAVLCGAVSFALLARSFSPLVPYINSTCCLFFFSLPFVRFDPQVSLFESIKPLFANKQLLVIANKTDVAPFADIK